MGTLANVWTTLPTGTDYQAFCYDEQQRLTWASSASGTLSCGGTWTAGSLTSELYTASYAYDALDRLTSGPGGSYVYGDSHHLDAATAMGSTYTTAYDAAGNMTCRAPTSATTCAGTQTGAQLSYDTEGRLATWQNAPSSPTSSTSMLYDGEGQRVEQQVTNGAATTLITDIGQVEELSTTAGTTTTTTSYSAGGQRIAQASTLHSPLGSLRDLGALVTAAEADQGWLGRSRRGARPSVHATGEASHQAGGWMPGACPMCPTSCSKAS